MFQAGQTDRQASYENATEYLDIRPQCIELLPVLMNTLFVKRKRREKGKKEEEKKKEKGREKRE